MSNENITKFVGVSERVPKLADMRKMLSDGIIPNVNVSDMYGRTALMVQANNGSKEEMEWLLKNNADPNIKNRYGATAIMFAIVADDPEKVRLLLDNGADRNIINMKGETLVQYAKKNNKKPEIITALESYYPAKKSPAANVNVRVNAKKF